MGSRENEPAMLARNNVRKKQLNLILGHTALLVGASERDMTPLIDMTLEAGPAAASVARRSLSAIADKVPSETFEDVRLLVSELVTNSVRHSGLSTGDDVRVGFVVRMNNSCLRVEVADAGKGFEKTVTPSMPDQQSGWGLQIVERLSDRWGVGGESKAGSTVWFEIDL
jgi:anti-sigma regulatory factor (Ser/Thr protein kinase)